MQPKKQLTEPKNPPDCGSSVNDDYRYYSYEQFMDRFFPNKEKYTISVVIDKDLTPDEIYVKLKEEAKKYCKELKNKQEKICLL